jgi:hypothetical protein
MRDPLTIPLIQLEHWIRDLDQGAYVDPLHYYKPARYVLPLITPGVAEDQTNTATIVEHVGVTNFNRSLPSSGVPHANQSYGTVLLGWKGEGKC